MKTNLQRLLIAIAVLLVGMNASAYDAYIDGIYYNLNSSKLEATVTYLVYNSETNANAYTGSVTIPETVAYNGNTYSVTRIGYYAFSGCSGLTSVTIPNSVTSIDRSVFYGCSSLTSITIPNSVTSIGNSAFYGCSSLTSITIPNSVTSIGNYAFSGCSSLTSVTIPNSVTSIGRSVFASCSSLTSVTIPTSVTSIGDSMFDGCTGLTSVIIPGSVTSIGNYAFNGCSGLKELRIEDGAETLQLGYNYYGEEGKGLFYDCPLETLYLGRNLSYDTDFYCGCSPFFFKSSFKSVIIGNSVTTIGDYAFCRCYGLTSIVIPGSVTTIGDAAFAIWGIQHAYVGNWIPNMFKGAEIENLHINCLRINSTTDYLSEISKYNYSVDMVIVENDVSMINRSINATKAVWLTNTPPANCSKVSSKVNYVSNDSYSSLSNVTVYPFLNSMFETDGITFVPTSPSERTCDAIDVGFIQNIDINKTVSYKGVNMTLNDVKRYSCYENEMVESCNIVADGGIGYSAFEGCTALKTISVSATSIGSRAFMGCNQAAGVTLSDNLTSVGNTAFAGCSSLESISIPDAVNNLEYSAFQDCSSLKSVSIGTGIKRLNGYTFSGCSSLSKINIPSNVTSIGDYVFQGCSSLSAINISDRDSELTLGSNGSKPLFADCPLKTVYIGGNISYPTSSSYGYSPFYRNTTLESVTITDKETEITENEFYGCTSLKSISIGYGVETIDNWAFSGCSSLDSFEFGAGMKTIGKEAFSDCTAMTKLVSHATVPPTCGSQALDDINKWNCELFVPAASIAKYQAAYQWKEFFFVLEVGAGINDVVADNNEIKVVVENGNIVVRGIDCEPVLIEVYSVGGMLVYRGCDTSIPVATGMYVVKVADKTYKVLI